MSTPLAVDSDSEWKERYFRVLFELDEKDRLANQRVAAITEPLATLVAALRNLKPQHDLLCGAIEDALGSGSADIDIEADVRALAAALATESPASDEITQLLRRVLPESAPALDTLLERRPGGRPDSIESRAWLGDFQAWLARGLKCDVASVAAGMDFEIDPFSRLLDNLHLNPPLDGYVERLRLAVADANSQVDILREVDDLASRLSSALQSDTQPPEQPQRDCSQLSLSMEHLLHRIEFPSDLSPRVSSLRALLGSAVTPAELQVAVEQFGELVRLALRQVRRDLLESERFLNEIASRLENIRGFMVGEQVSAGMGRSNRDELQSAIGSNVVRIREQLKNDIDVSEVKAGIAETLHRISGSLDVFLSKETERANQAEAKLASMSEHLEFLEREAEALRNSMQQEHQRATRDALTGTPNRLAYEERLQFECDRWRRYATPLSLVVVDVDHFKSINDKYGHQTGDRVLKAVAAQLSRNIRETDFICRYGGEEFVLLLPNTSAELAMVAAEKLRTQVDGCQFHYRDETVKVSVSCGVASFRGDDAPDEVFQRADDALYRAKHSGRNRCLMELPAGSDGAD
jgi:diguanylate cyclase